MLQVCLHILGSLLLCYAFYRLGANLELSIFASILFLVNVAHFRAIHWAICTDRIAAFVFGISTVITFSFFFESQQKKWLLATIILQFVAIFTHPSAAPVAFFCSYLAWRKADCFSKAISSSLPILLIAFIAGIMVYLISPQVNQVQGLLSNTNHTRIPANFLWYIGRMVSTAH
ncbi:MAG: hypothetical protein QGG64_23465 [Candidatus Latescibacteria bacterium]|nr:hypothetical protein [Candidatus Latescibacterota bacterium]